MIVRIVKMEFKPELVKDFIEVFESSKEKIRGFEGCNHLELLREKSEGNIFFTYSYWNDESFLEKYRYSELFKATWAKTKILFNANPLAWTVNKAYELP